MCVSSSHSVHRDFTYIDDAVDGILLAMNHLPFHCGEVFNIGHGRPHSLETLVGHLEEELGRRANKVRMFSSCLRRKRNNGLHFIFVFIVAMALRVLGASPSGNV